MKKKTRIAINGFGRIGRATFKAILEGYPELEVVAINDLADPATLAHLLSFDSCYGRFHLPVTAAKDGLKVKGKKYPIFAQKDPSLLPWKKLDVDVVLECTGHFRDEAGAGLHLKAGAKKVIISAPAKGKIKTVVIGVNEKNVRVSDNIISCASCTTNCLAPVTEVIRKKFGIKKALMSTVHAYTADQNLVDGPHKDPRRARAAGINIVPTTTGAAQATSEAIPSLKDKFDGLSFRVPVPVGSLCDTVYLLEKKTTVEAVISALEKAAASDLKGVVEVSHEELVSTDIIGNFHSSIVDGGMTRLVVGDLLKLVCWYDNEWGYSHRLADLSVYLGKMIK
jgi:glyceraldehyde 3-phosphate dehydrogenase